MAAQHPGFVKVLVPAAEPGFGALQQKEMSPATVLRMACDIVNHTKRVSSGTASESDTRALMSRCVDLALKWPDAWKQVRVQVKSLKDTDRQVAAKAKAKAKAGLIKKTKAKAAKTEPMFAKPAKEATPPDSTIPLFDGHIH